MPEARHGTIAGTRCRLAALAVLIAAVNMAAAPALAQTQTQTQTQTPKPASPLGPFDKSMMVQGVKFRVVCANNSSVNRLEIIPTGLKIDNRPISREICRIFSSLRSVRRFLTSSNARSSASSIRSSR